MGIDFKKLLALIAAAAAGLWFWDWKFIYPFKLLAVMVHETGHALAAIAVGGTVDSLVINRLEGGMCMMRIEPTFFNEVITSSAGYLGSVLIGAILVYASLRMRSGRLVLWVLSIGLVLESLLWVRNWFTVGVALGISVLFALAAKYLPADLSQLLAFFVSVFISLYALFDLKDDLWSAQRRAGTDAAILAEATHIPSIVWAVLWTMSGIFILGITLYWGTRKAATAVKTDGNNPRAKTP